MSIDETKPGDGEKATATPRTFTVSVLYLAELQGLKIDHAALTKVAKAKGDRWFVTLEGEVRGPLPLEQVFKLVLEVGRLKVLHESNGKDEAPAWRTIAYRAFWSNPRAAFIWTLVVHGIGAMLGWVFVCLITPYRFAGPVQVVYWIVAVLAIAALCIPGEIRERVKDRFRKKPAAPPVAEDANSDA